MKIRKVIAEDRPKISDLLGRVQNFSAEETACAVELLDVYLSDPTQKDYDFFCCVDAQESVLGYVCYGITPLTDAVYDLYWIVVDAPTQNRGVGKALVSHLDNLLLQKGARMLLAETSSTIAYGKTRSFYCKTGFAEISRIQDFYAENDAKITYAKFYSLYERRRTNQWSTRIEGQTDLGEMRPTSSGMIGTGKSETAFGH